MSEENKNPEGESSDEGKKAKAGTKSSGLKMNAKDMISEHAKAGTKIKYQERKEVQIVVDTKHYKKGQLIRPHLIMGEQLIKDGIAKEVKK